jgi:hypothetical protein
VSLLFIVPTDTLRHVVLFFYGSFALPLGRRSLRVMRITFLRLRRVRKILLIIMLHVVDRITTRLLNPLLLMYAHDDEFFNSLAFRLGVIVNLKSLKFLGQGRHNQVDNELILEPHVHRLELRSMLLIFRMCSLTPLSKEYFSITSLLMMVLAYVFEEPIN